MLDTVNNVIYKAFGLTVSSEIALPELSQEFEPGDAADILIEVDDITNIWSELSSPPKRFVITENLVLFEVPDIALFAIRNGNKITVSPQAGYDEEIVRLYLLGTCMGALLMQRRILPLHGSAVAIDGKAYAFTGESGAGKSTLATTFLNLGYQLLSDDVIAISFSPEQIPYVTPAYPQQKLWQESLNNFGMETSQFRSIYGRENKYCVPVTSKYYSEPLPLAGVYELIKAENSKIGIRRIEKLERFQTLFCHTYRNFLVPGLGLMDWHFNTSASILNHIDLYQLSRPASGFSAPQLAAIIQETIYGGMNHDQKPRHFA
ncbi:aldolase [Paenibacillus sp. LMG 31456]|uniref:Aldolase n=1 Tax=Paenibacillus foliorum TaxID=2654974 RepID=A0A972H2C7_9BACL|nr:aldolase [Paenibacillus foliorum]NOU97350.1 aldolase [Paenibacillus foliorum]